ncbi:hypothetical protein [Microbacterium sp. MPKO10]|uniref:hypothetical protein n=1 Tax=Microbacterium sp. MPKO10 TaxID=2989818 RepID=UPI0022359CE8|nr:hypothetical protein [Microbacterium sp. MPKO10]MCW4457776.1 hypothetical protein [Microbacterium sp. MPKO10]
MKVVKSDERSPAVSRAVDHGYPLDEGQLARQIDHRASYGSHVDAVNSDNLVV